MITNIVVYICDNNLLTTDKINTEMFDVCIVMIVMLPTPFA